MCNDKTRKQNNKRKSVSILHGINYFTINIDRGGSSHSKHSEMKYFQLINNRL